MSMLTRRKFFKLGAIASAAAVTNGLNLRHAAAYPIEGESELGNTDVADNGSSIRPKFHYDRRWRMSVGLDPAPRPFGRIYSYSVIMDRPSTRSRVMGYYSWNEVVPIYGQVLSDESPSHYNKIWYRTDAGFIHSAQCHPCDDVPNEPSADIPKEGQWAEVSVPSVFARVQPNKNAWAIYTYYYGSTFKIISAERDKDGQLWYQIDDELKGKLFFVRAEALRPIDDSEITPLSPDVPQSAKRIEVDLRTQSTIAYEYDKPVFTARCATGTKFYKPDGTEKDFLTTPGAYNVYLKYLSQHMEGGSKEEGDYYDLPGIGWVSYFTGSGIAFHSAYWHNDFGWPRSHGCVNLLPDDAKWIWRWTLPIADTDKRFTKLENWREGTTIKVHYSKAL